MADFAIKVHGSHARRESMAQAARNRRVIARRIANGGTRGHIPVPEALRARARRCPSAAALWVRVGGNSTIYRINGCFNVPSRVNCWIYPCGPTDPGRDDLLRSLDGLEVGVRIRRDSGGLTRFIVFDVYETTGGEPIMVFGGSGDCFISRGGVALPVHGRGIVLGGNLSTI